MNITIKTDAGNIAFNEVTKIQDQGNYVLNITTKKLGKPTKANISNTVKILEYLKIGSTISEYASSIEIVMHLKSGMKIEIS